MRSIYKNNKIVLEYFVSELDIRATNKRLKHFSILWRAYNNTINACTVDVKVCTQYIQIVTWHIKTFI